MELAVTKKPEITPQSQGKEKFIINTQVIVFSIVLLVIVAILVVRIVIRLRERTEDG